MSTTRSLTRAVLGAVGHVADRRVVSTTRSLTRAVLGAVGHLADRRVVSTTRSLTRAVLGAVVTWRIGVLCERPARVSERVGRQIERRGAD